MIASCQVERLTGSDVEAGLQLSTEAGWNQTAADWTFLLAAGQGFGVRTDGRLVATSLALPYPPDFGWISMVLVAERYRRRGLATLLLQAAVDHLLGLGLVPVLDATPEGRAVYTRLGFVETEQIDRWQGIRGPTDAPLPAQARDFGDYASLDLAAFGANRIHLLRDLALRPGSAVVGDEAGYAISRQGRSAVQIGPIVVARTEARGRELLRRILDGATGPIVADVPRSAVAAVRELSERGFSVQRQFHRMALGRSAGFGDRTLVHVIAGPELG
jgi:GNAT superfamily N-acetyltransferase